MMEAPTPGPWRVEELDGYITGRILGPRHFNGKPEVIVGDTAIGPGVQRQVDARLIAAAPDLLAAAVAVDETIRFWKRSYPSVFGTGPDAVVEPEFADSVKALRAAIAAATGEGE